MPLDRREFLNAAALGVVAGALPLRILGAPAAGRTIRAVAFDAFPIFDPRPVFGLAERVFPGRGTELAAAWRSRQFEYQWLRALGGRYADFRQATEDALVFAARSLGLDLTAGQRAQLMNAYLQLRAWPDVPAALASLRNAGLRLGLLSNFTSALLDAGIRNAGLSGVFEHVLSTDAIRSYKPDPRAYELGTEAFGLAKEEILFAAFAGWDVAGAKWFGYPTFWVNRAGAPDEQLGVAADGVGRDLNALVAFVGVGGPR
ncbi:MAG TPA: haloacid dehalogenase type II [Thermoanaerobaculia bacterium]|jgi:2-haloacid dehalogenase